MSLSQHLNSRRWLKFLATASLMALLAACGNGGSIVSNGPVTNTNQNIYQSVSDAAPWRPLFSQTNTVNYQLTGCTSAAGNTSVGTTATLSLTGIGETMAFKFTSGSFTHTGTFDVNAPAGYSFEHHVHVEGDVFIEAKAGTTILTLAELKIRTSTSPLPVDTRTYAFEIGIGVGIPNTARIDTISCTTITNPATEPEFQTRIRGRLAQLTGNTAQDWTCNLPKTFSVDATGQVFYESVLRQPANFYFSEQVSAAGILASLSIDGFTFELNVDPNGVIDLTCD
jgi:hypothetical protein